MTSEQEPNWGKVVEQLKKDNEVLSNLLTEKRKELDAAIEQLFELANEIQKLKSIYRKPRRKESWFDKLTYWLFGRW